MSTPYEDTPQRRKPQLTNLEREALVLVNEEVPGPRVTDEEKYEEILNQRKQRKAVSAQRTEPQRAPFSNFQNVSYSYCFLFL